MCTAICYQTKNSYFGRTLDIECSYGEKVTVTPRNFPFRFREGATVGRHPSIIGMTGAAQDYPLYYDAANEHGLAMAALAFPQSARYFPPVEGKDNIAPFELIPWVLAKCGDLKEARKLLERTSVCSTPFSDSLPLSPLHWIIADKSGALTVESTAAGLTVYENTVGVLTNEPPFDYQMARLCDYMSLSSEEPENRLGEAVLKPYSRGMGAMGLPGDFSSPSRFARAVFVKKHSLSSGGEEDAVGQLFHILDAVAVPYGCVRLSDGRYEKTVYSSCMSLERGIYYYTTYENRHICAVDMHAFDTEGEALFHFPISLSAPCSF